MPKYGICRIQKIKHPALAAMQYHNDRFPGVHGNKDIDPERTKLNVELVPHACYGDAVERIIADGYKGARKVRKDAVVLVEGVITASPDFFEGASPEEVAAFFDDARAFVSQEAKREENIVHFTIHNDESTPHAHFGFVPLTGEGKLSWKAFYDGNGGLSAMQDRFFYQVSEKHGLERGEVGSGRAHAETAEMKRRNAKELARQEKELAELKADVEKARADLDDVSQRRDDALAKLDKANAAAEEAERQRGFAKQGLDSAKAELSYVRGQLDAERGKLDELRKLFDKLAEQAATIVDALEFFAQKFDWDYLKESFFPKPPIRANEVTRAVREAIDFREIDKANNSKLAAGVTWKKARADASQRLEKKANEYVRNAEVERVKKLVQEGPVVPPPGGHRPPVRDVPRRSIRR